MATAGSNEAADDPSTGFIRFEVEVDQITADGIHSPSIDVLGTPWKLGVYTCASSTFLELYLVHRRSDCDIWSIDVSFVLSVVNTDIGKSKRWKFLKTFNHEIGSWGSAQFMKWDDVNNEDKGFIKDDKITIEARFTLSNVMGIRITPRIDFTDPSEPFHDIALMIEGEKVHVSKQILAVHSPVFKAMFYGNFDEKSKKEIELKDVNRKDFIEMLHQLYPSYQKITDGNFEGLLKLADRFQIKMVLDKVEQFIIDSDKLSVTSKLRLSDEYRLVKLQDHCLDSIKTVKEIQDLKKTDGYKDLSKNIKGTLLEKVMKLK